MLKKVQKAVARWIGHMESAPIEIRRSIVDRLAHPGFFRKSEQFEIDLFQFKYRGDLSSLIDRYIYFYGAFEKSNLTLLRDIALIDRAKSCAFVDVGANIGQHSLWMSKYCGTVDAFEPWGKVRAQMLRNVQLNEIKNIRIHDVGLGEKDDEIAFYAPSATNNEGVGSFLPDHDIGNRPTPDLLRVVRADDYFPSYGIRPTLMKIDVEGYEGYVLKGATRTISECNPAILMEFTQSTRQELGSEESLRDLLPADYEIYRVRDTGKWSYGLTEFDFNSVGVDLLLAPGWLRVENGQKVRLRDG